MATALEARELAERAIANGGETLTLGWDLLLRSYRMAQVEHAVATRAERRRQSVTR
jgi:hypothetical protein